MIRAYTQSNQEGRGEILERFYVGTYLAQTKKFPPKTVCMWGMLRRSRCVLIFLEKLFIAPNRVPHVAREIQSVSSNG